MEIKFNATVNFKRVEMNPTVVTTAAHQLMDNIAPVLVNNMKASVLVYGAEAGGRTYRSIRQRKATGGGVGGRAGQVTIRRQVVGDRGLRAMVQGRRAGGSMPARFVSTGPRGGKVFEPLPEILKWFNELGIPPASWFPIMRAISQRGVPRKPVIRHAVQMATPAIRMHARTAGQQIVRGLIQRAA